MIAEEDRERDDVRGGERDDYIDHEGEDEDDECDVEWYECDA